MCPGFVQYVEEQPIPVLSWRALFSHREMGCSSGTDSPLPAWVQPCMSLWPCSMVKDMSEPRYLVDTSGSLAFTFCGCSLGLCTTFLAESRWESGHEGPGLPLLRCTQHHGAALGAFLLQCLCPECRRQLA